MKHILMILVLTILIKAEGIQAETALLTETKRDKLSKTQKENQRWPFELGLTGDTYEDTCFTLENYEIAGITIQKSVGKTYYDSVLLDSTYKLRTFCHSAWGDIDFLYFEIPVGYYYASLGMSFVLNNGAQESGFILRKESINCGDSTLLPKSWIELYPEFEFSKLAFYNDEEELIPFNVLPINWYFHHQMLPVTVKELQPSKEYVGVIKSECGRHLRIEIVEQFFTSNTIDNQVLDSLTFRFSTDSCGNGKFKLKDTPIISPIVEKVSHSLLVRGKTLVLPVAFSKGRVVVTDLRGRELLNAQIEKNVVDLQLLPTGIYSVLVRDKDQSLRQKIFVP